MEGHLLLNLGLLEKSTGNIYYIQEVIDELDFNKMLDYAKINFNNSDLTGEELSSIEVDYLTLSTSDMQQIRSQKVDNQFYNEMSLTEDLPNDYSVDSRNTNLINLVPNSVFMSGPFDTWQHRSNSSGALYSYSYITYRFAGTQNRLTYIVFVDVPIHAVWDNQRFSLQMTLRDNKSVLYNVYDGQLGFFGDDNRITLSNNEALFTVNNTSGIITAREYTYLRQGSRHGNILKAIVSYSPAASLAISFHEAITNSADLRTGTRYTFHGTPAQQVQVYGGVVRRLQGDVDLLRREGDYFLQEINGNSINSLNIGYGYTVTIR